MQIQSSFRTSDSTKASTGTLYIVGTPIGNLEDMSYRAIRTLREVDLIAAEDTRQTRKLLTHFEIAARLVSYHEHNKAASGPELVRLLQEGQSIALVSDAGLPGISDPGEELVREAAEQGIPVVPIPGPNAALSALVVSGLTTEQFLFAGFPPRDRKGLTKWLEKLAGADATLLIYESPHRIAKTLQAMLDVWGDRRIAMVRELTKRYEEVARGSITSALQLLEERPPQGEYCLVVEGNDRSQPAAGGVLSGGDMAWWAQLSESEHVRHYEALGMDRKESMRKAAADRGVSKRDIYQACLNEEEDEA
jgi:16S rRNA (cytidine1402-2'-O)-methyltransferase